MVEKLILVYNAQSGKISGVMDALHKILSPQTYNCSLCKITHAAFGEKSLWKEYRKHSGITMEFLYADEFRKQYASKFGHKFDFPVVLAEGVNGLEIFVSKNELMQIGSEKELIALIENRRN